MFSTKSFAIGEQNQGETGESSENKAIFLRFCVFAQPKSETEKRIYIEIYAKSIPFQIYCMKKTKCLKVLCR